MFLSMSVCVCPLPMCLCERACIVYALRQQHRRWIMPKAASNMQRFHRYPLLHIHTVATLTSMVFYGCNFVAIARSVCIAARSVLGRQVRRSHMLMRFVYARDGNFFLFLSLSLSFFSLSSMAPQQLSDCCSSYLAIRHGMHAIANGFFHTGVWKKLRRFLCITLSNTRKFRSNRLNNSIAHLLCPPLASHLPLCEKCWWSKGCAYCTHCCLHQNATLYANCSDKSPAKQPLVGHKDDQRNIATWASRWPDLNIIEWEHFICFFQPRSYFLSFFILTS